MIPPTNRNADGLAAPSELPAGATITIILLKTRSQSISESDNAGSRWQGQQSCPCYRSCPSPRWPKHLVHAPRCDRPPNSSNRRAPSSAGNADQGAGKFCGTIAEGGFTVRLTSRPAPRKIPTLPMLVAGGSGNNGARPISTPIVPHHSIDRCRRGLDGGGAVRPPRWLWSGSAL